MRCNRLLQRSTFGTTEKELIKGSNLRHFDGSFRAERVLIRHRLKWTRHFAHATGTVSVRVRRTEVFESPFWESLSGERKFAITVFKPWEGRRYPQALNSFVWFLLKNSARESGSKTFCVRQDGCSQLLCGFKNFRFDVRFLCRKSIRVNINCRSTSQDTCTA